MQLLMNDQFAPITSTIGFLETNLSVAVAAFSTWQQQLRQERSDGLLLEKQVVSGRLANVLQALLPLNASEPQRYLFIPTNSSWIAYFDNARQGTDPFSMVSYLSEQIHCRGLTVTAIPNTINEFSTPGCGRYGAVELEIFGPQKNEWLNLIRSISVINNGGVWEFNEQGNPLPFERTENYQSEDIPARFTFEMLRIYLQALGLSPFDESFYLPSEPEGAVLIELKDPQASQIKEYSLAEVQSHF